MTATTARLCHLRTKQVLKLADLDRMLDVPIAEMQRFDEIVAHLVKEMLRKQAVLEVPLGQPLRQQAYGERVTWARLYESQVHRLARFAREEELQMARRYDFVRARATDALRRSGCTEQQAAEVLRGREILDQDAKDTLPPPDAAYLAQAMREWAALRNAYVEGVLYLVLATAQRYRNLGVDYADLVQEGNASLFQAIDGFDWRRDNRFRTYAQYWIQQAILKALYNASRTVRVPIWVQKAVAKIKRARDQDRTTDGEAPSLEQVGARLGMTGQRVENLLATKRWAQSLDAAVDGADGAPLVATLADDREAGIPESIADGDLTLRLREVVDDLPARERQILNRRYGLQGQDPETLGAIAEDLGITAERVRQLQNTALLRLRRTNKIERLRVSG